MQAIYAFNPTHCIRRIGLIEPLGNSTTANVGRLAV